MFAAVGEGERAALVVARRTCASSNSSLERSSGLEGPFGGLVPRELASSRLLFLRDAAPLTARLEPAGGGLRDAAAPLAWPPASSRGAEADRGDDAEPRVAMRHAGGCGATSLEPRSSGAAAHGAVLAISEWLNFEAE